MRHDSIPINIIESLNTHLGLTYKLTITALNSLQIRRNKNRNHLSVIYHEEYLECEIFPEYQITNFQYSDPKFLNKLDQYLIKVRATPCDSLDNL